MKGLKFAAIIILVVGVLFVAGAVFFYLDDMNFRADAIKTDATITSIESDGDSNTVYVVFYVDGKSYRGPINHYDSSMYVSKKIPVYYNPNNPNEFRSGGMIIATIVLGAIGGVCLIIGIGLLVGAGAKKKKLVRVMGYNFMVNATITGVRENLNYSVNGKHPYILEANIQGPNGKFYYFKSENLWQNVTPVIEQLNMRTIPVYVNPNNYNEYVIYMEPITNYLGN